MAIPVSQHEAFRERPARGSLTRHFLRIVRLPPGWFIVRVAVESLVLRFVALFLLVLTVGHSSDSDPMEGGFLLVAVAAPVLETLLLQSLPVRIAQFFTRRTTILFLCAWLPFGLLHFTNSFNSGIAAGLIGGWYLAFTYVVSARRSHWKAIVMTAAVHALGNAICYLAVKLL
jgi:hypothetical protein